MSDLDDILRESLGHLAEPGDTAGVADAVAAKAAALGGGAAGGGAAGGGFAGWVIPVVLGMVAVGGGVTLGVTSAGAGGSVAPYSPVTIWNGDGIPAAACPGGPEVTSLDGGARVLAVARSEDGAYLAVRDPEALTHTVWVASGSATADPGEDVATLPVLDCLEASAAPSPSVTPSVTPSEKPTVKPTPKPTKTSSPKPTKTSKPKPTKTPDPKPVDEKPTLALTKWSPGSLIVGSGEPGDMNCDPYDQSATMIVHASDDHSGLEVTGSANFYPSGLTLVSHSGSTWKFKYVALYYANGAPDKTVTIKFTAKDSAGHAVSKSATMTVITSWNRCLG